MKMKIDRNSTLLGHWKENEDEAGVDCEKMKLFVRKEKKFGIRNEK